MGRKVDTGRDFHCEILTSQVQCIRLLYFRLLYRRKVNLCMYTNCNVYYCGIIQTGCGDVNVFTKVFVSLLL